MGGSLNQPSSVQDDGPMGCKLLSVGNNSSVVTDVAGTGIRRTGYFRASSRANTEGPGVIRSYWV